ncbi:MAG: selenocysteine-specific translation elongation factor [Roseibacillus sp.]|nr:selenocysteine-specific translation elongation factor [Roseibacillus sp.]
MSSERHYILGTAGHIDHGKSSLVRALTGTDPDRLPEEQRRGVTIELGFAHLTLEDESRKDTVFELGIVDVPGHADFVNNMVAGVGGMDVALFVVAADDGWMPQSEEHLHILTFLGVRRCVVALTKSDLAEDLDFSIEFVRDSLRNTILESAPIVPVSSITGQGIEQLRTALCSQLISAPPVADFGKPLLPVDRAFSVKGIGTVVTGTLSGGSLGVGDSLILQPVGLPAHVRAIQNHSHSVESAHPGMRTALNLPELQVSTRDRSGAGRGTLVTGVQAGKSTDTININMQRLNREIPGQLATRRALPSGRRVRVHHGSGSTGARIFFVEGTSISPGQTALAQLRLDEPRFMMVGDHVVLRDWSGEATVGGGLVLDADASRRRLRNEEQVQFLRQRAEAPGNLSVLLTSALERDSLVDLAGLKLRLRFPDGEIDEVVKELLTEGVACELGSHLAAASWWKELLTRASDLVGAFHRKNADLPGLHLEDLRKSVQDGLPDPGLFDLMVQHLGERGVVQRGTILAQEAFSPALSDDIRTAAERIEQALRREPLSPPGRAELAAGTSSQRALSFLIRSGAVTELTEKVIILTEIYDQACEQILDFLQSQGQATASDLRQHLDTSRRIIMPLLERMDTEGKTRRNGDYRTAIS